MVFIMEVLKNPKKCVVAVIKKCEEKAASAKDDSNHGARLLAGSALLLAGAASTLFVDSVTFRMSQNPDESSKIPVQFNGLTSIMDDGEARLGTEMHFMNGMGRGGTSMSSSTLPVTFSGDTSKVTNGAIEEQERGMKSVVNSYEKQITNLNEKRNDIVETGQNLDNEIAALKKERDERKEERADITNELTKFQQTSTESVEKLENEAVTAGAALDASERALNEKRQEHTLALEAVTKDGTNAATEEEKKDATDEMDALVKQQEIDIQVPVEEMKKNQDRVNAVDRLKREAADRIKSKTAQLKLALEAIPDAREIKGMDDDISQMKLNWAAMETDLKQCDVKICVLGDMMREEQERLEISLNSMREEEVLNRSRRPRKRGTVRGVEDRNSGRNPRNGQLLQAVKLGMKLKNGSGELYISEAMAKEWGDNPQFLSEVLLWMQDRMVLYDTDEKQIESCPIARLLATMMGDMNLSYTGIPKRVTEGMNAFHLLQWSSKTVKTQVPKLLEVAGEIGRAHV
jgi:hypothetical protein